jgi:replicative DNA helicase
VKKLPWNEEAEQAVLSACFMDPKAITESRLVLRPESFFRSAHCLLYSALCAVSDRGEVPDYLTVSAELDARKSLDAVGGKDYIGWILDCAPTAANVAHHARLVRETADRRAVISVGERLIEAAHDQTLTPDKAAQIATSELLPVAAHTKTRGFVPISEVLVPVLEDILTRRHNQNGLGGYTWGYDAIDEETGGYRPGEVIFFCGVPGSGKTALALNVAKRNAQRGNRCAIVSAEMGTKALVERIVNAESAVSSKRARKGEIDDAEWNLMVKVSVGLKSLPLTIDDTAQPNIRDVVAKCRAEKAKYPDLRLIVVDFIQLLQSSDDDNRSLELTEISYALKGLAKELEVGIIVTCQVDAAAVEKTSDHRPQLHHLRWSQAMREAGDFVCLIFNPTQRSVSPRKRGWSDITVTDQFCGAGGSSIGAHAQGLGSGWP